LIGFWEVLRKECVFIKNTLIERVGAQRIEAIVESFYAKVEKNPKLNAFFGGKNMNTIKKIVAEHMKQICSNPNLQFSPRIKKGHATFQINDV
jgi:truncated hemoglobin YjbI